MRLSSLVSFRIARNSVRIQKKAVANITANAEKAATKTSIVTIVYPSQVIRPSARRRIQRRAIIHFAWLHPAVLGQRPQFAWRVHVLAADGVGDLRHVDVAVGVYGYAVGGDELAAAFALVLIAEHADAVAVEVVDADAVAEAGGVVNAAHAVQLADVDVLAPEDHGIGAVDVAPHGDEVAFGIEDLDAMAFAVYDVNALVAVEGDVVGANELTGVYARLAPGELVLQLAGVDVDAGVAVAVGNVDVAVGRVGGSGSGTVEGLAAPARGRIVALAQLPDLLAVGADLR